MKPSFYVLLFVVLVAIICHVLFPDAFAAQRYLDINRETDLYLDSETGVVYYLVHDLRGVNVTAICPRYNADGTLYTSGVLYG